MISKPDENEFGGFRTGGCGSDRRGPLGLVPMDWVSLELDSMGRALMGSIRARNYQIDLKPVK